MKKEELDAAAAIEAGKQLPFALLRFLSAASLGATPAEIPAEELEEGRFFSETEEIRVFRTGKRLNAVRVSAEPGDEVIEKWLPVDHGGPKTMVRVTRTLKQDEEGQAYIADLRLSGWERRNEA